SRDSREWCGSSLSLRGWRMWHLFFFFQAEDGIRAGHVTGVQTCALPIYLPEGVATHDCPVGQVPLHVGGEVLAHGSSQTQPEGRSEERRVGKEGRSRRAG